MLPIYCSLQDASDSADMLDDEKVSWFLAIFDLVPMTLGLPCGIENTQICFDCNATVSFPLQTRTQSVDLNTDTSLMVDISDALSERDRVKFTVHTKVSEQN